MWTNIYQLPGELKLKLLFEHIIESQRIILLPFDKKYYDSLPKDKEWLQLSRDDGNGKTVLFTVYMGSCRIGIAGCYISAKYSDHGHLIIYIEKEFRGKGLLYNIANAVFKTLNLKTMASTINKSNIASIKSHQKSGIFKPLDKDWEKELRKNGYIKDEDIRLEYIHENDTHYDKVSQSLKDYGESKIQTIYKQADRGHQWDTHLKPVIDLSFDIVNKMSNNSINHDMLYAACALHDIGRQITPKNHEELSANITRKMSKTLSKWFDDKQIETIAQAVEDHGGHDKIPRSIYGEILSDADHISGVDIQTKMIRSWYYRRAHVPKLNTFDKMFEDIFDFQSKPQERDTNLKFYTKEGRILYNKVWEQTSEILKDKNKMKSIVKDMIKNGILLW